MMYIYIYCVYFIGKVITSEFVFPCQDFIELRIAQVVTIRYKKKLAPIWSLDEEGGKLIHHKGLSAKHFLFRTGRTSVRNI